MNREKIKKIILFILIWFIVINSNQILDFIWSFTSDYIGDIFLIPDISNNKILNDSFLGIFYLLFNYELPSVSILIWELNLKIYLALLIAGFTVNPLLVLYKMVKNKSFSYENLFKEKITIICGSFLLVIITILSLIFLFNDKIVIAAKNKAMYKYKNENFIPKSIFICDLIGGYAFSTWQGFHNCFPPASDAGKICTDDSQCEKYCVVSDEEQNEGKCFKYKDTDWCRIPNHISNGKFIKRQFCIY